MPAAFAFRCLALPCLLALASPALAQPAATSVHDGSYPGTRRFVSGTGCGGSAGFPIVMTVAGGVATMPLRGGQGGLRGPVGADGSLDALKWYGFAGITEMARGRIQGTAFSLDYIYDYPAASHLRCNFVYEGQRRP